MHGLLHNKSSIGSDQRKTLDSQKLFVSLKGGVMTWSLLCCEPRRDNDCDCGVEYMTTVRDQCRSKFDMCDNYGRNRICGNLLGPFLRSFEVIDGTRHERWEPSTRLRYTRMITSSRLQVAQCVHLFICASDFFWNQITLFNYIP